MPAMQVTAHPDTARISLLSGTEPLPEARDGRYNECADSVRGPTGDSSPERITIK